MLRWHFQTPKIKIFCVNDQNISKAIILTQQTKKAGEEQYVTAGLVNQGEHKGHLEGQLSNCDLQSFSGRFDTDKTAVLTFLLLSKKGALLSFASPNVKKVTNFGQFSKGL